MLNGICKGVVWVLITVVTAEKVGMNWGAQRSRKILGPLLTGYHAAPEALWDMQTCKWLQTALVQQMTVDYNYQVFGVYRCTPHMCRYTSPSYHSLNQRHKQVMLQEAVSFKSQPSQMKKGAIKNSAQSDMQIRKNSRYLCHLSPIILLITSHCERLALSTGSLIIHCICPHFPQSNQ